MTEAEWPTSSNPEWMFDALREIRHVNDRKLRLFTAACCRSVWHLLKDQRSRRAVEIAEQYADQKANDAELLKAAYAANEAVYSKHWPPAQAIALHAAHLSAFAPHTIEAFVTVPPDASPAHRGFSRDAFATPEAFAKWASIYVNYAVFEEIGARSGRVERNRMVNADFQKQSDLLRDIFGNPFHPVQIERSSLPPDVIALAHTIYEDRSFQRMPELAVALEGVGWKNEDILGHCRSGVQHVRGCWVVDLILGKESAMTEAEWLKCNDPNVMVEFLRGKASDRKLRFFVFACVRRLWDMIPTEPLRFAVETSERHADGLVDDRELGSSVTAANRARPKRNSLARAAYDAARYSPTDGVHTGSVTMDLADTAASAAVSDGPPTAHSFFEGDKLITAEVPMNPARRAWNGRRDAEYASHCEIIRDIFGNPFRPITLDSLWLNPAVISLAQTIYDERAFDRMPELADALEAAGCKDANILAHCHSQGPHVRGCWVIDSLLGKR